MKLIERSSRTPRTFSGKVRVTIIGLALGGGAMTDIDDMPTRSLTLSFTTVNEVYDLIYSIVKDSETAYRGTP